jgi:hypothetical protein
MMNKGNNKITELRTILQIYITFIIIIFFLMVK